MSGHIELDEVVVVGEEPAAGGGERTSEQPPDGGRGRGRTRGRTPGRQGARRWTVRRLAAGGLVVLLALAGVLLLVGAEQRAHSGAVADRAVVDGPATAAVIGDVSDTLSRVLSYGPTTLDATEASAAAQLDQPAAAQYRALVDRIRGQVAAQGLTLTTTVDRAGVAGLTGNTAHLVVFLDQTSRRPGGSRSTAAAQLSVTARQENGSWRITTITVR